MVGVLSIQNGHENGGFVGSERVFSQYIWKSNCNVICVTFLEVTEANPSYDKLTSTD